ncbi:MAG: hypothetical protein RL029_1028, partial [Actinomycetota bacterium]
MSLRVDNSVWSVKGNYPKKTSASANKA